MAFRLTHWLALMAAGCAVVAIWALPPRAADRWERAARLPEEQRLAALQRRALMASYQIQRTRWADSLIPATLAGAGPVTFGFPEGSDADAVASARTRARDDVGGTPSDMALGLFFLPPQTSAYPGTPIAKTYTAEYYFGARDGRPYCVAAQPEINLTEAHLFSLFSPRYTESHLGLCALLGRYGLPGPAVQQWLAVGGTALAASIRPEASQLPDAPLFPGAEVRRRRGPLGMTNRRFELYSESMIPLAQCASGYPAGCAEIFLYPARGFARFSDARGLPSPSPVSATQAYSYSYVGSMDTRSIARLAQEFGPERFQRWWTADGDVADAFQASFGLDVGSWTLGEISKNTEITKAGPGVAGSGLLGGLLIVTLSGVIAGMWAIRRRVA